jgi:hypothetical protein
MSWRWSRFWVDGCVAAGHFSIDGKRLLGSTTSGFPDVHLLAAFSTGLERLIGHLRVDHKSFFATLKCSYLTAAGSRLGPRPGWPDSASSKTGSILPWDTGRFAVLPKCWIVERTIGWLNRCRRPAQDWGCLSRNDLAFPRWASIRMMLRKLCRNRK